MLEMLGVGKATPESFSLKKPYEGARVTLSCTDLMDIPVLSIIAMGSRYMNQYRKKVNALKEDEATKEQERVRQDYLLDPFRDPVYPDHIELCLSGQVLRTRQSLPCPSQAVFLNIRSDYLRRQSRTLAWKKVPWCGQNSGRIRRGTP